MEANARSPRDLFEGKEHYEIPPFQRPYVWNEEDQWAPLWDDVVRVAESYVEKEVRELDQAKVPHHFLGAVVYESKRLIAGDVSRHVVIDGQQRMTTLQVLIDAARQVFEDLGHENMAETMAELTRNGQSMFRSKRERFKLWPSQIDRDAFEHVMEGKTAQRDHQIPAAHDFFAHEVRTWIEGQPDADGQTPLGDQKQRVMALAATLQDNLLLVAIDLTGHDDAQLIFETLNDRGTPLLKADLIKNWVFRRAEKVGADTEQWAADYWSDFDSSWWREEITQGRLTRSRVDIFLQYWLTMRLMDEVKADQVFRVFVEHAEPLMKDAAASASLLTELHNDAETYRGFAQLDASTPQGHFHQLVIETLEQAVTTPAFLWLVSKNHDVPDDQVDLGLRSIESWVVRRTLLRRTTKDMNKFMVSVLRTLDQAGTDEAGESLRLYLSEQTAETRAWPTDEELLAQLPQQRIYGNLTQRRVRTIYTEIERYLRHSSANYEDVSIPAQLEIEHIMPRGWRTHWNGEPPLEPEAAADRDWLINTLGNLTLITKALNGSLSNRPWTDPEADGMKEGGWANVGKRSLLEQYSLLVLNKKILQHEQAWTETDIADRGRELTECLCAIWAGPDLTAHAQAVERSRDARPVPSGSDRSGGAKLVGDVVPMGDEMDFTWRKIKAWEYDGAEHPVDSWKAMLVEVMQMLATKHRPEVHRLASDLTDMRVRTPEDESHRNWCPVDGNVEVWAGQSTYWKVGLLRRIFHQLGLDTDDLVFHLRPVEVADE